MEEDKDAANTVNPFIEKDLKERRETGIDKALAQAIFGESSVAPPAEKQQTRPGTRSARKRLYENPPESPAKIQKTDKSPTITIPLRSSDNAANKRGTRKSTVKDVQQKELIVANTRPKLIEKKQMNTPPQLSSYRKLLQVILNLTSRDTPLQDQVDNLITEVGSSINPICRQLLEAFKREDADAQHFAIFSLGYTMCKDQYLEQNNKSLKEEISETYRRLSSISDTLQEIKPYIEQTFKEDARIRKQEIKEIHDRTITVKIS